MILTNWKNFLGLNKFVSDTRGEIDKIITAIIAIVVGALLMSALLPNAIQTLLNSRNASWAASVLSTWDAIPILATVAGLLVFVAVVIDLTKK